MKIQEMKKFETNEFDPKKYFRNIQEKEKIREEKEERKKQELLSLELSN